ncbi:unnamed protein product [Mesocestoides corti]|uniref:Uncharacterized protein n=1 Tax=Mesocestoides corti TaxID=53468 RepID=A0A0R3U3C7_MESCO|nr:unnamed protein product [Mesocestoides corti]
MEPAGWHCLLYAVVYATSLAALRRARDQFHSVVCGAVGTCFCDRRLAWTLVRSLPMGASVEWQFATSHDASLHEKTVLRGDGSPPARCVLILFKSGAKPPDVNYPIVPVLRFLDESIENMCLPGDGNEPSDNEMVPIVEAKTMRFKRVQQTTNCDVTYMWSLYRRTHHPGGHMVLEYKDNSRQKVAAEIRVSVQMSSRSRPPQFARCPIIPRMHTHTHTDNEKTAGPPQPSDFAEALLLRPQLLDPTLLVQVPNRLQRTRNTHHVSFYLSFVLLMILAQRYVRFAQWTSKAPVPIP